MNSLKQFKKAQNVFKKKTLLKSLKTLTENGLAIGLTLNIKNKFTRLLKKL